MVILLLVFSFQMVFANNAQADVEVQDLNKDTVMICENRIDANLNERFEKLRKSMENGFSQGLPAKLKSELLASRHRSDDISLQVHETHIENDLEVNGLVQKTLDHLEEYIGLVPRVATHAPKVRDEFVIPLTNVSSLQAENKECYKAEFSAQAEAVETTNDAKEANNKYALITDELNRLNNNLYEAQTISPQKFIAYRGELQAMIAEYNKNHDLKLAAQIKTRIPQIVNNMQQEVEVLLPGFELSSAYQAIVSN